MSKSSGEFLTVSLLQEKGYNPMHYRFFCLQSHYRRQLVFSYEGLDMAKAAYEKLYKRLTNLKNNGNAVNSVKFEEFDNKFKSALSNDLNTAMAVTCVFDVLKADINDETKIALIKSFDRVLGLNLAKAFEEKKEIVEEINIDAETKQFVEKMIEERKLAKAEKNYSRADEIRNELASKGIELIDTKEGTTYKIK